jgi:hypothetical protein
MTTETRNALVDEAREFCSGWESRDPATAYRPFDQADRIPFWDGAESPEGIAARRKGIAAWEAAHGHSRAVKCYAEFGCMVIEAYGADLILRLIDELAAQQAKITESLRRHVIAPESYPPTKRTGPRPTRCQYDGELWPCDTVKPFIEEPA